MQKKICITTNKYVPLDKDDFPSRIYKTAVIMSSPITLAIAIALGSVAIINFKLDYWYWFIIGGMFLFAIAVIVIKRLLRKRKYISKRYARRNNDLRKALLTLNNNSQNLMEIKVLHNADKKATLLLFQQLGAVIIKQKLYDVLGIRYNRFTGRLSEYIVPIKFYSSISTRIGAGYILLEPYPHQMRFLNEIDEKVISSTLKSIGLIDWSVVKVASRNDVSQYLIKSQDYSNAYDFSSKTQKMYDKFLADAEFSISYMIKLQPGLVWNMRTTPHALISGVTGSGKSYFVNYLLIQASVQGNILYLCDPKNSDIAALSSFMPKDRVGTSKDEICKIVEDVVEAMNTRYAYMQKEREATGQFQADFVDFELPVIMLVIDELAAFVSGLDKKTREKFDANIQAITLQGRQAGINLCSIMQSPNANNITTESRSQMGLRVFLGNSGGIEYRMLFGEGYSYPSRTYKVGQGLLMLSGYTESPTMIETPKLDKSQLAATLKAALKNQHKV